MKKFYIAIMQLIIMIITITVLQNICLSMGLSCAMLKYNILISCHILSLLPSTQLSMYCMYQ